MSTTVDLRSRPPAAVGSRGAHPGPGRSAWANAAGWVLLGGFVAIAMTVSLTWRVLESARARLQT